VLALDADEAADRAGDEELDPESVRNRRDARSPVWNVSIS